MGGKNGQHTRPAAVDEAVGYGRVIVFSSEEAELRLVVSVPRHALSTLWVGVLAIMGP